MANLNADQNPTTDDNFIQGATLPYIIAGCVTLPMCIFVIYTFAKYKQFRKHPSGLLLGRTFADLGFVLSVVLLSIITDWIENEIDTENETTQLTNTCVKWGVLTILFLNTSQFYFIGMCYDLYVCLRYPLRSQLYTAKQVHFYSWFTGVIMAIFSYIFNIFTYSQTNEVCFFDKSSLSITSLPIFIFGVPYIIGVLSGIASLIFVSIRLKNGLGDVFSHAKRIVNEHIFFVSLYVLLGVIWWTLLLTPFVETQLVPFIIIIVVGTPAVDALSWFFQKFRTPFARLKSKRQQRSELFSLLRARSISTLNANQDDYIEMATLQESGKLANAKEQSISQALRMELIRSICGGISDGVSSAHKQSQLFDDPNSVTPLHFAPVQSIDIKIGSDNDRDWIVNQCIQRFNVNSNKNKGKYQFIDYSPHVFKYLRKHIYGINDYQYIESMIISDSADISNVSAKFSEGKSGSFFFQTQDNQYMIKTISKSEFKTFLKMLPGYFEHVRKYQSSFINRYYGAYSIKIYGTKIYFTVMKNIFTPGLEPHEKYDIKGSWRNRHTNYHIEEGRLMKDEDLHKNILLSHEQSKKAWDQLNADTRFLTNLGVMDYSLLLGIYYIGVPSDDVIRDDSARGRNWSFAHGFMYQQDNSEYYSPPLSPNGIDVNESMSNKGVHDPQHMKIQIDEYDREMAMLQNKYNKTYSHTRINSRKNIKSHLLKGLKEEDEIASTMPHSHDSSMLNEPLPTAFQQKNSSGTVTPIQKRSIDMKEMEMVERSGPVKIDTNYNGKHEEIGNSMGITVGSYSNINIGTPEAMQASNPKESLDISYLKLDPSFRKKKNSESVHSNLHNRFNEPSVTIQSTFPEASVSMTPQLAGILPVSQNSMAGTSIRVLSSPGITADTLVSSYNTAEQRMSYGAQAPSHLVPSEDMDNKTLRDIQSIAPDDEENIKLLKHEQGFLRRRAFTTTSGMKQVSTTKNTFQARTIEGPGFYCLGIIDILQEWDWNKKLERFFKIYFRCQDSYGISCIEPTLYRKRFLAKMLQVGIGRKTAHV